MAADSSMESFRKRKRRTPPEKSQNTKLDDTSMTPSAVHYGENRVIYERRRVVLLTAYSTHPERFVRRPPRPPSLPEAVWINPPSPPEVNLLTRALPADFTQDRLPREDLLLAADASSAQPVELLCGAAR